MLPGKEKEIIVPEGGWERKSYYLVEVSYRSTNPIHRAIFYTGFLNGPNGEPCNYAEFWGGYDSPVPYSRAYYLKPISLLVAEWDMKSEATQAYEMSEEWQNYLKEVE